MVGDNAVWGDALSHLDGKGVFMGAGDLVGHQPSATLDGWARGEPPAHAGEGPVVLPFRVGPSHPDVNAEFNLFLKEQLKAEVLSRQGWTGKCEGLRAEVTRLRVALAETISEVKAHNREQYFETHQEVLAFWESVLREGVGP